MNALLKQIALAALVSIPLSSMSLADCNCQGGVGEVLSNPMPMESQFMDSMALNVYPLSIESGPVMQGVNYNPAPPPGTIGQTYQLSSKPVPVKKHPRTGIVDVRVVGATEVIVHDVNPMRTEDLVEGFRDANDPNLWHFATEPLYPGLPHIYRIEAHFGDPSGGSMQERYVRLIRGRIVTITF